VVRTDEIAGQRKASRNSWESATLLPPWGHMTQGSGHPRDPEGLGWD